MTEERLMELARDAGLPITFWDKAKSEGKTPPCWRELGVFAELIKRDLVKEAKNILESYNEQGARLAEYAIIEAIESETYPTT